MTLLTQSAQNSKEIQKLLQAEKKAHEIVQKARGCEYTPELDDSVSKHPLCMC